MSAPRPIDELPDTERQRARALAADLVHDVGKYVARAARNIPEGGPIAATLVPMLLRDCFETHAGRPASVRFEELAAPLEACIQDARIAAVRAALGQVDALADAARRSEPDALLALARHAREIDALLRELSRALAAQARRA